MSRQMREFRVQLATEAFDKFPDRISGGKPPEHSAESASSRANYTLESANQERSCIKDRRERCRYNLRASSSQSGRSAAW